jgi:AraC-like DNA-binding protein
MTLFALGFGLKTTAMQFGYFMALLFTLIFLVRGFREDRLSDKLLGMVMFFLAMDLQDYTFGFAGINILWEQMNGLPRHFPWIYPASVFFYFKAQTNAGFRFSKKDWWHVFPYLVYVVISMSLYFLSDQARFELDHSIMGTILLYGEILLSWFGLIFYFSKCIMMYHKYEAWVQTEHSNVEPISYRWLRNFVYVFMIGTILRIIFKIIDHAYNLDFNHDYYWQLFTVFIVIYVAITGLSQVQDKPLNFEERVLNEVQEDLVIDEIKQSNIDEENLSITAKKLIKAMEEDQAYLNPDLTLSELAKSIKTNTSVLSNTINQLYKKNFNDYINEFRVEAYKSKVNSSASKNMTLIGLAYECGFNSKSTFHRAVKKVTGLSPKELMEG